MFGEGAYKNFGPKLAPITDDPLPSLFKLQRINSTNMAGYFTLKFVVFTYFHECKQVLVKKFFG